jgi:hypothetical protein
MDCAEAEEQALRCKHAADFFNGCVLLRTERRHNGVTVGIDATGTSITAERLWAGGALFALKRLPPTDACGAHPKAFSGLAVGGASRNCRENANS